MEVVRNQLQLHKEVFHMGLEEGLRVNQSNEKEHPSKGSRD
jgi:hypothetical protein